MKSLLVAVTAVVLFASASPAQVHWQPQPAPLVTAEREGWFQLGEPITFEGYYYYSTGPRVFFNGNVMVRTGAYRGIPLYADTTIEPYSKVFVPVSGGQLQPYERRRTGDIAGTTGSQAPSFPVAIAGERTEEPVNVGTAGAIATRPSPVETAAGEATAVMAVRPPRDVIEAGHKPKGLNEIYVNYSGYRWRAAGRAVRLDDQRFRQIGEYSGYPVYADRRAADEEPRVIYLPSRAGLIAPYERAGRPVVY